MKNENFEDPRHFTEKYTKTNILSEKILENFFASLESLLPSGIQSLKEVGCGAGFSMEKIKKMLPQARLSGSDIDPELVRMARARNPEISFTTESVYQIPDQDNSYDLVLCLEVLEHLDHPDQALKELMRVSSNYVIVSTPREPLWRILNCARGKYLADFGNTPGHINHWSKKGLTSLVAEQLDIVRVKSPIPWTMILAKKKKT